MSSGSLGKSLFNNIKTFLNIEKLLLYCGNINYHSIWFNKSTFNKFGAIYESP